MSLVSDSPASHRPHARFWPVCSVVLAGLAVALGAWAAHGLEDTLTPVYGEQMVERFGRQIRATEKYVGDFRTGVTYQMWHALALLSVAGFRGRGFAGARWLILSGTVIFSGSLYVLALSGVTKWGAVTPIGGLLLLVGWATLAIEFCRSDSVDLTKHSEPG